MRGSAPTGSILIVDDDADVRGALAALLEVAGYDVAEAADGRAALVRLRAGEPVRVILLDLFMPGMNGWEFLDEKARDPRLAPIPVLVVTADPAAARQASGASVIGALCKPVAVDEFLRLIAHHCG